MNQSTSLKCNGDNKDFKIGPQTTYGHKSPSPVWTGPTTHKGGRNLDCCLTLRLCLREPRLQLHLEKNVFQRR